MTKSKRIGVLTGGGDCPGLNAVIRAVYRSARRSATPWEVIGIENGFAGLLRTEPVSDLDLGPGYRRLRSDDVRGILPRGGTILGTSNKADPFRWAEPDDKGVFREIDASDRVVGRIRDLELSALVVIGGDGTQKIAHALAQKGVCVVGVPKTIDNDLSATDATFGFDTAVQTAVEAIDKLHTTAESHERIMLLEVMGRNAGWIALHAGIAGGADIILIPEIPYNLDSVKRAIERRKAGGRTFGIIVVAEGAKPDGQGESYIEAAKPGQVARLGGAAEKVASLLCKKVNLDYRVTVLGHLQRGGTPSPIDRLLGTRFGVMAMELVEKGQFDQMVCLRTPDIVARPIAEAVAKPNLVDPDGQMVRSAEAIGINFGRG